MLYVFLSHYVQFCTISFYLVKHFWMERRGIRFALLIIMIIIITIDEKTLKENNINFGLYIYQLSTFLFIELNVYFVLFDPNQILNA